MLVNFVGNFDVFVFVLLLHFFSSIFVTILAVCCIIRGKNTDNDFCILSFTATLLFVSRLDIDQDSSC